LTGMEIRATTTESTMAIPPKPKNTTIIWFSEYALEYNRATCTSMFIEAILTNFRNNSDDPRQMNGFRKCGIDTQQRVHNEE
jgi:hypothetical protein